MSYIRTEENRKELSKARIAWWANLSPEEYKEFNNKLSEAQRRRWARISESEKEKFRINCETSWTEEKRLAAGKRIAIRNTKRPMSEKLLAGKRGGEAMKKFWMDSGNEVEKELIKKQIVTKALKFRGMTGPEQDLLSELNILVKDEYKFNNGWFILGGKVPDFVNVNGKKKLIEMFGEHWHSEDEVAKRISYFRKFGYQTLILWDWEVGTRESSRKLRKFVLPWHRKLIDKVRRWLRS